MLKILTQSVKQMFKGLLLGTIMSVGTSFLLASHAFAASTLYEVEPTHTYPSFEADHFNGLSVWRGKFNKTSGTIDYDKAAQKGTIDITIDTTSIDYGLDAMNDKAKSAELFDVTKYPTATYKGQLSHFKKGAPTQVTGFLTLKGVTQPLDLKINSFKCIPHPMLQKEVCGADASAHFMRDAFGLDFGKQYGFKMDVYLRIQVEAVAKN